jgi:hypothetical protein
MRKKFCCSFLLVGLVTSAIFIGWEKEGKSAAEAEEPQGIEEVKPLRNVVEIKAEGEILQYRRESLWNEKDFAKVLESKKEFKSNEIMSFKKSLERYNKYAVNPEVEFNEVRKSTALTCDIKGATYSTNSYDFHWLLGDLPFDLYQFKQSEKELYYKGEVNDIPATIRLIFPYVIAHCHEHVWPGR